MTVLLDRSTELTSASADARTFTHDEGVSTMTTTATHLEFDSRAARRPRPHGLDLLVMRVSLAMLVWARRRADRVSVQHEERLRQHHLRRETERREHEFALRAARVR